MRKRKFKFNVMRRRETTYKFWINWIERRQLINVTAHNYVLNIINMLITMNFWSCEIVSIIIHTKCD